MDILNSTYKITVDVSEYPVYDARGSYEREQDARLMQPKEAIVTLWRDAYRSIAVTGRKIRKDGVTESRVSVTVEYLGSCRADWPAFVEAAFVEASTYVKLGDRHEDFPRG